MIFTSKRAQIAAIGTATLASGVYHWGNDGLWFQGDAPRHLANGVFLADLLRALPTNPLDFALSYYARYPIIVPVAYPPLFYVLEAALFSVFPPSPAVPRILVLLFTALAGLYAMAWARSRMTPAAGWCGACLVVLPAFVTYGNSVLLNLPAVALSIGALYHLQEWLSSGSRRQRLLFVLLTLGAILTYLPSATMLPIAIVWVIASKRWEVGRSRVLWLTVGLLASLVVLAWLTIPIFSSRNAPTVARLLNPNAWSFYGRVLLRLTGPWWLAASIIGLLCAATQRRWRADALRLGIAYPITLLCLVPLPAFSERYALLLIPISILSIFLGLVSIAELTGRWRQLTVGAGTLVIVLAAAWSGAHARVPAVSGFRDLADYFSEHAPDGALLYSGRYDGVVGFYVRASDPIFERRVVFTKPLLYRAELDSRFLRIETPKVSSPADVVAMIRDHCGCQWIAVERGDEKILAVSDLHLRKALDGPEFELVESFPISGAMTSRVDLYRFKELVQPVTAMDLEFPAFSSRVFRGIRPIPPQR